MHSYTAADLERATGFDRRTIAYYVQEGLIPKVGRRGPRTRYPKLVRDRLLFIRHVREAEEGGALEPVSLSEMREIFARVPPTVIEQVAENRLPVTDAITSSAKSAGRSPAARREALNDRWMAMEARDVPSDQQFEHGTEAIDTEPVDEAVDARDSRLSASMDRWDDIGGTSAHSAQETSPAPLELALRDALLELQVRARKKRGRAPQRLERWSRIEISPDMAFSVRGVTDEDAPLLELVGTKLRQLIAPHRRKQ